MTEEEKKSRRLVEEFVIPKCSGKAFIVKKGQILRVIAHEGKQVADIKFLNAHHYKEQFAACWSTCALFHGGQKRITELYSKPPWERVMLTVIDDKVGDHFFSGSCSPKIMEFEPDLVEGDKSCVDLFAECLRPYGVSLADLDSDGTFNVFMVVRTKDDKNGDWQFFPPSCEKGDYIEFLAEMDILVAATSCPDKNVINDFKPKAMKYQIFESY
jgi:uncharacterized protein YcgI (DUF1989 family)